MSLSETGVTRKNVRFAWKIRSSWNPTIRRQRRSVRFRGELGNSRNRNGEMISHEFTRSCTRYAAARFITFLYADTGFFFFFFTSYQFFRALLFAGFLLSLGQRALCTRAATVYKIRFARIWFTFSRKIITRPRSSAATRTTTTAITGTATYRKVYIRLGPNRRCRPYNCRRRHTSLRVDVFFSFPTIRVY